MTLSLTGSPVPSQRLTGLAVRLASSLLHRALLSQQRQEQAAREQHVEALRYAQARRLQVNTSFHGMSVSTGAFLLRSGAVTVIGMHRGFNMGSHVTL